MFFRQNFVQNWIFFSPKFHFDLGPSPTDEGAGGTSSIVASPSQTDAAAGASPPATNAANSTGNATGSNVEQDKDNTGDDDADDAAGTHSPCPSPTPDEGGGGGASTGSTPDNNNDEAEAAGAGRPVSAPSSSSASAAAPKSPPILKRVSIENLKDDAGQPAPRRNTRRISLMTTPILEGDKKPPAASPKDGKEGVDRSSSKGILRVQQQSSSVQQFNSGPTESSSESSNSDSDDSDDKVAFPFGGMCSTVLMISSLDKLTFFRRAISFTLAHL